MRLQPLRRQTPPLNDVPVFSGQLVEAPACGVVQDDKQGSAFCEEVAHSVAIISRVCCEMPYYQREGDLRQRTSCITEARGRDLQNQWLTFCIYYRVIFMVPSPRDLPIAMRRSRFVRMPLALLMSLALRPSQPRPQEYATKHVSPGISENGRCRSTT